MKEFAWGMAAAIVILPAFWATLQRNIVYAAFLLMASFIGVALLLLGLSADFLAVTQLLVYVGGILTLFLFGVLVTNRRENRQLVTSIHNVALGRVVSLSLFVGLFVLVANERQLLPKLGNKLGGDTTLSLGEGLVGTYLLPFELAGMLLLAILVGVLYLSSSSEPPKQ